jgi:polar amino acid transport system substrate-binding protein
MKWKIVIIIVIMCNLTQLLEAQQKLVFSRTEKKPHAGGFLMGELIIREAYKRLGLRIELKEYPAERAISVANDGAADGNLQRSAGAEKQFPNLIMVPFPIMHNEHVVFTKKKVFTVNGYTSLKPYSILIFLGNKPTERGTKGMQVTSVTSPEQAFKMLDSGRADIFIYPREGICIAKELGLSTIKVLEPPVEKTPVYHYLNKRHSALVPSLLNVLKNMEKEGVIQRFQKESLKELWRICY